MWREYEVMNSPEKINSGRGVLDRASLIHQFMIVRSPRVPRARARDRGLNLLREEVSLEHQWRVLLTQQ